MYSRKTHRRIDHINLMLGLSRSPRESVFRDDYLPKIKKEKTKEEKNKNPQSND